MNCTKYINYINHSINSTLKRFIYLHHYFKNMKVRLGKSSIYSSDGITIIPKLVREHLNITSANYKEFEIEWFLCDDKIVLEIRKQIRQVERR